MPEFYVQFKHGTRAVQPILPLSTIVPSVDDLEEKIRQIIKRHYDKQDFTVETYTNGTGSVYSWSSHRQFVSFTWKIIG